MHRKIYENETCRHTECLATDRDRGQGFGSLRPAGCADLQERRTGLLLENREGLLQARDLGLPAALALLVGLRLRDAHALELLPVLHDGGVLLVDGLLVLLEADEHLLRLLLVLALVLGRRRLLRGRDLVVLGQLLVLLLRHGLLCGALGEALREVRLHDLEHADDAARGAGGLVVLRLEERLLLLRVVVTEHLERHANALDAGLVVRLGISPGSFLLRTDLVRLLLRRGDGTELLLERRDLLRELGDLGRGLVDLRGEVLDIRLLVLLLRLGLLHLLVAEGLVRGLLGGLLLELLDHLRDEALDLREGVRAEHRRGLHARRQQGHLLVALRETLDEVEHIVLRLLRANTDTGRRGHLDEGVFALGRAARLFHEHLLRRVKHRELLAARVLRRLVLLRLRHALLLEVLEVRLGIRESLGSRVELALRSGLSLLRSGLGLLRLIHDLLSIGHHVLELLLQHVVVELGVHLGLLRGCKLSLRLLEHILQNGDDAAGLGLVSRRVRGASRLQLEREVFIAALRLDERSDLEPVGGVDARGGDEALEGVRDLLHGRAALDEASLRHLPLDDGDRPLEHANGLSELLLQLDKVRVLLLPNLCGRREILLGRGDRRAELLDLRLSDADLGFLVRDGRFGALNIRFGGLDLKLRLLRLVVAEGSEFLIELRLRLSLLDDLSLEALEQLDRLLDRRHRSTSNEERKKLHCTTFVSIL